MYKILTFKQDIMEQIKRKHTNAKKGRHTELRNYKRALIHTAHL